MPESMERIGDNAFYECSKLKRVVIPKSVTWIGARAFGYSDNAVMGDFVLLGGAGTIAEAYAEKNGISFCVLNKDVLPENNTKQD